MHAYMIEYVHKLLEIVKMPRDDLAHGLPIGTVNGCIFDLKELQRSTLNYDSFSLTQIFHKNVVSMVMNKTSQRRY